MQIYLQLWYVELHPAIHESNKVRLLREAIRLPINVTEIKTKPIGQGYNDVRWTICKSGVLPKKVTVGFLDTRAFHGSQRMNAFYFRHFGINFLQLRLNGRPFPVEPFTPNFAESLVMRYWMRSCRSCCSSSFITLCSREFRHFYDSSGFAAADDAGTVVTYSQFCDGMTLFPFDFSPDACNGVSATTTRSSRSSDHQPFSHCLFITVPQPY